MTGIKRIVAKAAVLSLGVSALWAEGTVCAEGTVLEPVCGEKIAAMMSISPLAAKVASDLYRATRCHESDPEGFSDFLETLFHPNDRRITRLLTLAAKTGTRAEREYRALIHAGRYLCDGDEREFVAFVIASGFLDTKGGQ